MSDINQIEKSIKKINERRAEIQRQVMSGKLPKAALIRYDNAMRSAAGSFIREGFTQRGKTKGTPVLRIEHGKRALEEIDEQALNALLQRPTAGAMKKDIKRAASENYGRRATRADIEQYMSDIDYVDEALREHYQETYDALDRKYKGTSGKKTYHDLRETIEEYRELKSQGLIEENPFDVDKAYFSGEEDI